MRASLLKCAGVISNLRMIQTWEYSIILVLALHASKAFALVCEFVLRNLSPLFLCGGFFI